VLDAQQPRAVGERPLKQRDCLVRPPSSVVGHRQVCEAIRNSPVWDTSLLIITYDEHGGFYDSVAPPAALPPNDGSPSTYNQWGFAFAQLGVRVPAVVVSPWIAPHTVDHTVYDHSSVPATIERLFGLPPLTARDAAANDVTALFTEAHPRTDARQD
jgi:phospholipase C